MTTTVRGQNLMIDDDADASYVFSPGCSKDVRETATGPPPPFVHLPTYDNVWCDSYYSYLLNIGKLLVYQRINAQARTAYRKHNK